METCRMCGTPDVEANGFCFDCTVEYVQDWEYNVSEPYAILHDDWNCR